MEHFCSASTTLLAQPWLLQPVLLCLFRQPFFESFSLHTRHTLLTPTTGASSHLGTVFLPALKSAPKQRNLKYRQSVD